MKHFFRLFIVLGILISLMGCVSKPRSNIDFTAIKEFDPDTMTTLQMDGKFSVRLFLGAKKNHIYIKGLNSSVSKINAREEKGKFILTSLEHRKIKDVGNVEVDVYANDVRLLKLQNMKNVIIKPYSHQRFSLYSDNVGQVLLSGEITIPNLTLKGKGVVSGEGKFHIGTINNNGEQNISLKGLDSKEMIINNNGAGSMFFRGYADVKQINQTGKGSLDLYWLKGKGMMKINLSGSGKIKLAGTAKKVEAQLKGHAILDMEYLRAETVLVRTFEQAKANVRALTQLMAYAGGKSLIKYYGSPTLMKSSVFQSTGQGVVLQGE